VGKKIRPRLESGSEITLWAQSKSSTAVRPMAIRISVQAVDPHLEGLLNYIEEAGLSAPTAKHRLFEEGIAWVKLSDRFNYDAEKVEVVFDTHPQSATSQSMPAQQNQATQIFQEVEARP